MAEAKLHDKQFHAGKNRQIDNKRPNAKAVRDEIIKKAWRARRSVALVPYSAAVPNGYWSSVLNINEAILLDPENH